jgi:hypothetical protein
MSNQLETNSYSNDFLLHIQEGSVSDENDLFEESQPKVEESMPKYEQEFLVKEKLLANENKTLNRGLRKAVIAFNE